MPCPLRRRRRARQLTRSAQPGRCPHARVSRRPAPATRRPRPRPCPPPHRRRSPNGMRTAIRAISLALVVAAAPAAAQDRASAEELFQLGKATMARHDYTKACGYFQASLSADFALGTLVNLALCHEESGKIATAWGEFRLLEERARKANPPQTDRAELAHQHAEALRPRLSRIHIVLSPAARAHRGLAVKIDGIVAQPELF